MHESVSTLTYNKNTYPAIGTAGWNRKNSVRLLSEVTNSYGWSYKRKGPQLSDGLASIKTLKYSIATY